MNQRTGHVRRGVAGLAAAAMLALTTLAAFAGTATPAAAADPPHQVEVRITEVAPQVLSPGEDLTVRVALRNTGQTAVAEPTVALHLDTGSFISRTSLDRWRTAGPDDRVGTARAEETSDVPLEPDGTRTLTLTLPADATGLGRAWETWGAHGIAVSVVDDASPAPARLGVARSFMLWFPPDEVTPTRVSVLVPVVGGPPDGLGGTTVADLDELTSADGRLAAVLEATREHRDVAWLLDPALVETREVAADAPTDEGGDDEPADGAGDPDSGDGADGSGEDGADAAEETTAPTTGPDDEGSSEDRAEGTEPEAPSAATETWVAELLRATVGRDVPLLPWGDTDVTALAHADEADVLRLAQQRTEEVADRTDLPDTEAAALVLPAEDLPDRTTAGFAQSGGTRAVVVAPGQMLPPGALTYTPSGRTTVTTESGEVTVLVPDERLSTALRTGAFGSTWAFPGARTVLEDELDGEVEADPQLELPATVTPATAAQDILAELAVVTRERPSDSRHLLLTVPRDWHPDPEIASAQLAALSASPWVRTESVSALVGTPDPEIERGTLPEERTDGDEISQAQLDTLEETLTTRTALAEMAAAPGELLGLPDDELLSAVATAWRSDPEGRRALIARSVQRTEALRSSVQVRTGSRINLISTTGELPVVVENTLDQPVEIAVVLQPRDVRLRVDAHPTITLAAGTTETVHIPVHAIQSGTVPITVELRTVEGVVIDDSAEMHVLVRAEWEGIGTAVLGVLLALGVLVSIIRTIRRGRTPRRAEPVAAGPDALSPEEAGR